MRLGEAMRSSPNLSRAAKTHLVKAIEWAADGDESKEGTSEPAEPDGAMPVFAKAHKPDDAEEAAALAMVARVVLPARLKRLLDATHALALKTQRFHWNVTGPSFPQLHDLFGKQYDELNDATDEIAERIKACQRGLLPVRPLAPIIMDGPADSHEMCASLATDHDACALIANTVAKRAEEAGDAATVDLAGRRAAAHEKAAWMLRATATKPQPQVTVSLSVTKVSPAERVFKRLEAASARLKGDKK